MKSIDEMIDELKSKIFDCGMEAIDDLLGFECNYTEKDTIDNLLDEVLDQMPEEEITEFYKKYCLN